MTMCGRTGCAGGRVRWPWLFVFAVVAASAPLSAQAPDSIEGLTFEVAVIRPNPSQDVNLLTQQVRTVQQRVVVPSTTVRELIRYAYDYQFRPLSLISGGPAWLDTERYEVTGLAAEPFSRPPSRGMLPKEATAMLRNMLAERMQLKVRIEMQERTVYALVLDRDDGRLGPNLTPAADQCQGSMATPDPEIPLPPCPFVLARFPDGTTLFELKGITMAELASNMGNFPSINDLVIDRTGLEGRYDMSVRSLATMALSPNAPPAPLPVEASDVPPIESAIRQQLGLRLQRIRAPVEVIVIEHVERPSEN